MEAGDVIAAGMARPLMDVKQAIAVRVLKEEMEEQKKLVSQIVNSPDQVAPQVYNSHGEIVPTPAGTSVDGRA